MKTSCLRHPETSRFVRRHDWQIKALAEFEMGDGKRTEIPHCAAELMSVFEYHYNNRLANRLLRQLIEQANQKHTGALRDVGEWMPYSMSYLMELLLQGRGTWVLTKSLEALEQIGFISSNVPEDITSFYSKNMKWFRLNVDFINQWIDENMTKTWQVNMQSPRAMQSFLGPLPDEPPPPPKHPGRQTNAEAHKKTVGVLDLTKPADQVKAICQFYKHVHAKTNAYVFDNKREALVAKILKQPGRTIGMAAQAIIGNVCSDFHQGRHKDNHLESGGKLYDSIEYMFRDANAFEKHVGYAERQKVTEEVAAGEFKIFLDGGKSKFAKKATRERKVDPTGKEIDRRTKLSNEKLAQYREFARTIASFFTSDVENSNILELCRTNSDLKKLGKGLTDMDVLLEAVIQAVKVYRPQGLIPSLENQITKFCQTFTKLQSINK